MHNIHWTKITRMLSPDIRWLYTSSTDWSIHQGISAANAREGGTLEPSQSRSTVTHESLPRLSSGEGRKRTSILHQWSRWPRKIGSYITYAVPLWLQLTYWWIHRPLLCRLSQQYTYGLAYDHSPGSNSRDLMGPSMLMELSGCTSPQEGL